MKKKDLRHLSWSISRASSGTAGSFLKSFEVIGNVKYYYKVSNFDTVRGIFGHECVNEIVAQNVADILQIPHLHYELIHADIQIDHISCFRDGEAMRQADPMKDGPVNNYVGSKSLTENLKQFPLKRLQSVRAVDFTPKRIFAGAEGCQGAVPAEYWETISGMIHERVGYIEEICHQGRK